MFRVETIRGWDTLPDPSKDFIDALVLDGGMEPDTAVRLTTLLLEPDRLPGYVVELSGQTAAFRVKPEDFVDSRLIRAYQLLHEFVDRHFEVLSGHRVVVVPYGSLIYADPRNLDCDLQFVTIQENTYVNRLVRYDWGDELNAIWEEEFGSWSDIHQRSIQGIKRYKDATCDREYSSSQYNDIDFNLTAAAMIFTGPALFEPAPNLLEHMQQEIWNMALEAPLMAGIMAVNLEACINDRLTRRGYPPKF
ncbi:hypothetical protein M1555_00090 [Patescibacteria group bacterium]|nr:hypothetical protein [Patescibacteria group bacterium]